MISADLSTLTGFSVSLTDFGPISRPNSSRLKGHSAESHGFQSHNVDRSVSVLARKKGLHI